MRKNSSWYIYVNGNKIDFLQNDLYTQRYLQTSTPPLTFRVFHTANKPNISQLWPLLGLFKCAVLRFQITVYLPVS